MPPSLLARLRAARERDRAEVQFGFERVRIEAKATIEEMDDWWIVKDNVLVKAGVFNGIRRDPEILADVWKLYEGIPITHPHPEGLVENLELVGGIVQNVRYDAENARVLADYAYARHENVDGLRVNAQMLALNEETIKRVRAGEHVENSQGYLFEFVQESGELDGKPYDVRMTELIPNHLATLLDEDGACSWEDGCGLARLALERAGTTRKNPHLSAEYRAPLERHFPAARKGGHEAQGTPPAAPAGERTNAEDHPMCDKDCEGGCVTATELKTKLDTKTSELQAAQTALDQLKNHKATGGGEASTPAQIASIVTKRLERLAEFEAAEAKAHEKLAKELATLAREVGGEKAGKEEDLVAAYKKWPAEALLEHRSLLQATKGRKGGEKTRKDNLRPGAEAEPGEERRMTVGVHNGKEWVS